MDIEQDAVLTDFQSHPATMVDFQKSQLDIHRLVKSAAYAAECAIAVLLVGVGSGMKIVQLVGANAGST